MSWLPCNYVPRFNRFVSNLGWEMFKDDFYLNVQRRSVCLLGGWLARLFAPLHIWRLEALCLSSLTASVSLVHENKVDLLLFTQMGRRRKYFSFPPQFPISHASFCISVMIWKHTKDVNISAETNQYLINHLSFAVHTSLTGFLLAFISLFSFDINKRMSVTALDLKIKTEWHWAAKWL